MIMLLDKESEFILWIITLYDITNTEKNNLFRKNKGMLLKSFMTKESFIFIQAELLLQKHVYSEINTHLLCRSYQILDHNL